MHYNEVFQFYFRVLHFVCPFRPSIDYNNETDKTVMIKIVILNHNNH